MSGELALEAEKLCEALLLGGGLGIFYDLLRMLRRRLGLRGLGTALDLLFWLGATAALFLWSDRAWNGQVRLYGALFALLGGAAYFFTLSPPVLGLFHRLADFCGWFFRILAAPLYKILLFLKKTKIILENLFLFRVKWYRIGQKPTEMDGAVHRRLAREKGER